MARNLPAAARLRALLCVAADQNAVSAAAAAERCCWVVAPIYRLGDPQRLGEAHALSGEVADGGKAQLVALAARDPGAARTLFACELLFMVCEHALFLAFVCGMASGIGADGVA